MTNFYDISDNFNIINSVAKNDYFEFQIKHSSSNELEIGANVKVSVKDNVVHFKISEGIGNELLDTELVYNQLVRTLFDNLKMHAEIVCDNDSCHMNYFISTLPIYTKALSGKNGTFQFFNPEIYMEAFTYKNLWIQNDWDDNKMRVFNRDRPESIPIIFDIVEFDSMPKDKLIHRIVTMVNFS